MKRRTRSQSDGDLYGARSDLSTTSGGSRGSRSTFPLIVFDEPPMSELDTSGRCSEWLTTYSSDLWCQSCRDASLGDGRRRKAECERPLDDPGHALHAEQSEHVRGYERLRERKLRSSSVSFPDIGPSRRRRSESSSAGAHANNASASSSRRRPSSAISAGSGLPGDTGTDGLGSPRPPTLRRRDSDVDVSGGGDIHTNYADTSLDTSLQPVSELTIGRE